MGVQDGCEIIAVALKGNFLHTYSLKQGYTEASRWRELDCTTCGASVDNNPSAMATTTTCTPTATATKPPGKPRSACPGASRAGATRRQLVPKSPGVEGLKNRGCTPHAKHVNSYM